MKSVNVKKVKSFLVENFSSNKQPPLRTGMTFTPKSMIFIIAMRLSMYAFLLLSADKKTIKVVDFFLILSIQIVTVVMGGLLIFATSIYLYIKISKARKKLKDMIKAPENIKIIEDELNTIETSKTSSLKILSLLQELLRKVKNLESALENNNKIMEQLKNENNYLKVENKSIKKNINEIIEEMMEIRKLIHKDNGGV